MELFEGDYVASEKPPWCYRRFPEVEFLSCEKTQFNGYPAFYSECIRKSRGYERRGCGTVYDTYCSFRVEWVCDRYIFQVYRQGIDVSLPASSNPV